MRPDDGKAGTNSMSAEIEHLALVAGKAGLLQRGVHEVGEVEYLILEEGGKISVVADAARAPPSETDLFSDVTRGQTRSAANTITALT